VTFRLEGTTSNRDGIGAKVIVQSAGGRQVAQRVGGRSYLSACDGRLHFGLGASPSVDSVEVHWPSGRRDRWTNLAADAGYRLREGDPAARPLAGFPVPGVRGRDATSDGRAGLSRATGSDRSDGLSLAPGVPR
jgi:hypothetical protein